MFGTHQQRSLTSWERGNKQEHNKLANYITELEGNKCYKKKRREQDKKDGVTILYGVIRAGLIEKVTIKET